MSRKKKKPTKIDKKIIDLQNQIDSLAQMNIMLTAELLSRQYPGRMAFSENIAEARDIFFRLAKELEEMKKPR